MKCWGGWWEWSTLISQSNEWALWHTAWFGSTQPKGAAQIPSKSLPSMKPQRSIYLHVEIFHQCSAPMPWTHSAPWDIVCGCAIKTLPRSSKKVGAYMWSTATWACVLYYLNFFILSKGNVNWETQMKHYSGSRYTVKLQALSVGICQEMISTCWLLKCASMDPSMIQHGNILTYNMQWEWNSHTTCGGKASWRGKLRSLNGL